MIIKCISLEAHKIFKKKKMLLDNMKQKFGDKIYRCYKNITVVMNLLQSGKSKKELPNVQVSPSSTGRSEDNRR